MKCTRCSKNNAIYHQRYSGQKLCKYCFIDLTNQRIRKTISKHNFFNRNDKVAVMVSGGKDSITLLHFMNYFSEKTLPIELHGVIVDEGIHGYRNEAIPIAEENFKQLDIPFEIISFEKEFGSTLDKMLEKGSKIPCTYCGVFRRRLMDLGAKRVGANKLVTGHNLDDEVQSIFMNYIRGDFHRLVRSSPDHDPSDKFVPRMKPLREIPEKEVAFYALLKGFKIHDDDCPKSYEALRNSIRGVINTLEEKHPGTKYQILSGADNLVDLIRDMQPKSELRACKTCGESSGTEVCKICDLLKEVI